MSLDVLGYHPGGVQRYPAKPEQKETIMPDLTELSEGETALRAVERDWNAAAKHWNSAGLVALYTEDAVFYGGRPGHAVGHAKVREYFDSYVGTLAAARLALVDQELRKPGGRCLSCPGLRRVRL